MRFPDEIWSNIISIACSCPECQEYCAQDGCLPCWMDALSQLPFEQRYEPDLEGYRRNWYKEWFDFIERPRLGRFYINTDLIGYVIQPERSRVPDVLE
jgi:hypothetical protein